MGTTWLHALRSYSVLEHVHTVRAVEVRAFPWGDVPGQGAAFNARWAALRAFVERVVAGDVADPCPRAVHWGGRMDVPRGKMIPARCAAPTANTFYAVLQ